MIPWSEKEVQALKEMHQQGTSTERIAGALGRSRDAVTGKMTRLGLKTDRRVIAETEVTGDAERIAQLERRLAENEQEFRRHLENYRGVELDDYFGKSFRFIACGDTQFGSRFDRHDLVNLLFGVAEREGIRHILHAGDFHDGMKVYRGQEFEQDHIGADQQLAHSLEIWPKRKGIETYFIGGNHDYAFFKHANFDICKALAAQRPDCHLLGQDQGILTVRVGSTDLRIGLWHPDGGTAYALSYKPQKLIEALPGGEKPHVLLIGHFHKAEFLPSYRNVAAFQVGCLQSQTPFMRRRGLAAHLGFWIIELHSNEAGLARVKGEFIPAFEAW